MNVVVVGGAGYIGSHMVRALLDAGHRPITFDSLVTGHRDAVTGGPFLLGDLADRSALQQLFASHQADAVMHFASFIQVGESVREPAKYYANNFCNTLNLLGAMRTHGVRRFIFSSTAAIFGEPSSVPIDENHLRRPLNPYGVSKLMVERVLEDFDTAYGLRSVCLRYFNAAGAHPGGTIGERHDPETHLIPLLLQVASERREEVSVFGDDYETPDGTCIRDYIHVDDLCQAHLLALDHLVRGGASRAYNLGNGAGFSVREVIASVERVTNRSIRVVDAPRRPGDPARLVADATLIKQELGWQPRYPDLDTIVRHGWQFEMQGFGRC